MKNIALLLLHLCISVGLFAQNSNGFQHKINLDPTLRPFYHGVESGDPMPDKVIIWTRVTPDSTNVPEVDVYWQIATDVSFNNVVNYGRETATPAGDYTVKVDVCGLQPGKFYYYMFNALGSNSIIGRTKTAPAGDNDSVRFAVVSCASWEHGYFNAYDKIADKNNVDAVVCLGDYVYEYASGDFSDNIAGRTYDPPGECITYEGYEMRYSQYKLDEKLRRLHQYFPFITVWDDHETANDAWRDGAQNHNAGEGLYSDRKRASTSTYFRWMPIRKPDANDTIRIFRKLRYGKLLDLIMLDTRLYDRDEQDLGAASDPTRHIMGPVERAWFLQQLDDTTTRWKIIGNQVMFAPVQVFGNPVNPDFWDGYNYERGLIQDHIMQNSIKDIVFLTGDIHTSWCNDVPGPGYNAGTGAGSICVEFTGTSVTSFNLPLPVGSNIIQSLNPHVKYVNVTDKGYYIVDIKKNKTQADYNFVSVDQPTSGQTNGPSFYVNEGNRHLVETFNQINSPQISAPIPPALPNNSIGVVKIPSQVFLYTQENMQESINIIPSANICPAVTFSIPGTASHGFSGSFDGMNIIYQPQNNYNGPDTIIAIVCDQVTLTDCDTIMIFINVAAVFDIDTNTIQVRKDSSYNFCLHFDDVNTPGAVSNNVPAYGTVNLTDTCFSYTTDSAFCGTDYVTFTTCETPQMCDTIVYAFSFNPIVSADTTYFNIPANSNLTYCYNFNDLSGTPGIIQTLKAQSHGTLNQLGDSCIKYFPFFNYTGYDTISWKCCDNCAVSVCDTVTLVIHSGNFDDIPKGPDAAVIGLFPNPTIDKVVLQYYLFNNQQVSLALYDGTGKLIDSYKLNKTEGINHFEFNLANYAKGMYTIQLQAGSSHYTGRIVKE
jgi:alkaline phosphatase D